MFEKRTLHCLLSFTFLFIISCNANKPHDVSISPPKKPGGDDSGRSGDKGTLSDVLKKVNGNTADMDETDKDLYSQGGQPGSLSFFGDIVVNPSSKLLGLDKKMTVVHKTGRGWRGTYPKLDSIQSFSVDLSQVAQRQLESTEKGKKIFINCDPNQFQEKTVSNTEEKEPIVLNAESLDGKSQNGEGKNSNLLILKAEQIFLCDLKMDILNQYQEVTIVAQVLYLSNVQFDMTDKSFGKLHFIVETLKVEKNNEILISGVSERTTSLPGPELKMSVKHPIEGEGVLKVSSSGGDFIGR